MMSAVPRFRNCRLDRSVVFACILPLPIWAAEPPAPSPASKTIVITKDSVFRPEAATLPLGDLSYQEFEPLGRQMLSQEGTIGYFARRNAVIVYDNPANIAKIREFLKSADRPTSNIQLEIIFAGNSQSSTDAIGVQFGDGRRPPVVIVDGEVHLPNRISIDGVSSRTTQLRDNTQRLMVRSGSAGSIWAGEKIPDPAWLASYHFQQLTLIGGWNNTLIIQGVQVPWRDVGSSLYARPTLRDDGLIDVELFPVISYVDNRNSRRNLRVEKVETTVTVAPGQAITLGGIDQHVADFMSRIGAQSLIGRRGDSQTLAITLRATVITPPTRPPLPAGP